MSSACGDFVPHNPYQVRTQILYRGEAGPPWGTSVTQTPSFCGVQKILILYYGRMASIRTQPAPTGTTTGSNPRGGEASLILTLQGSKLVRKENKQALDRAALRIIRWMCGVQRFDRHPDSELESLGSADEICVSYGHALRNDVVDWVEG